MKIYTLCLFSLIALVVASSGIYASESVKIAAIFPQTGIGTVDGLSFFRAVDLAVEQLNGKGGIDGHHIELIKLDNQSTPLGSRQAALQAVKLGVTAVIGSSWSSHSLAMAPVLQKAGIPMISPISTSPKLSLMGNYIFRVCFTNPFQGKVMAQFAKKDLQAKTAAVVTNIDNDYSIGLAKNFIEFATRLGIRVLWKGQYTEKDIDFSNLCKKILPLNPDIIFVPGYERDSGFFIRQARMMGIKSIFLGGDGWSGRMFDFGKESIDGSFFSTHWHSGVISKKSIQLQKDYKNKFHEPPFSDQALAHDAVMLLADAITRAKSLDRSKIRDAIAATKDFEGITGLISFDENGDPFNKDAVIMKLDKNKSIFVKTIRITDTKDGN